MNLEKWFCFCFCLKRIFGLANLTLEEMNTVMAQIEAVLNSRPLTAMTQDPSDLSVLTPGHFLIGRPLTAVPEPSLDHIKTNRLTKYQRLHQLSRHFWDRWHSEYLVQLQQRHKWKDGATTIQVGTLASYQSIREENVSPLQWKLG